MRKRKSGIVANFGSIGDWKSYPLAGIYCATKAAIALYTDALRVEEAPFGIKVTTIEVSCTCGMYNMRWANKRSFFF